MPKQAKTVAALCRAGENITGVECSVIARTAHISEVNAAAIIHALMGEAITRKVWQFCGGLGAFVFGGVPAVEVAGKEHIGCKFIQGRYLGPVLFKFGPGAAAEFIDSLLSWGEWPGRFDHVRECVATIKQGDVVQVDVGNPFPCFHGSIEDIVRATGFKNGVVGDPVIEAACFLIKDFSQLSIRCVMAGGLEVGVVRAEVVGPVGTVLFVEVAGGTLKNGDGLFNALSEECFDFCVGVKFKIGQRARPNVGELIAIGFSVLIKRGVGEGDVYGFALRRDDALKQRRVYGWASFQKFKSSAHEFGGEGSRCEAPILGAIFGELALGALELAPEIKERFKSCTHGGMAAVNIPRAFGTVEPCKGKVVFENARIVMPIVPLAAPDGDVDKTTIVALFDNAVGHLVKVGEQVRHVQFTVGELAGGEL